MGYGAWVCSPLFDRGRREGGKHALRFSLEFRTVGEIVSMKLLVEGGRGAMWML